PSPTSVCTAAAETSCTTQVWPPRSRRRTMFAPMRPSPIMPICIRASCRSCPPGSGMGEQPLECPSVTGACPRQCLAGGGHDAFRCESELRLERLQGGRSPERLHADHFTERSDVCGPAEGRGLLDRDTRRDRPRQDALAIRLRLPLAR